ncbi:hypothetical protein B0H34DRAFT_340584 [Crassisporium funariophilum]|nr:hypothetical protein B0H34DRAFT_340584 [Crassisporium funariophilum]
MGINQSTSFVLFDMMASQREEPAPAPHRGQLEVTPLSFDRVHAGQRATSTIPIFRFPIELFNHFTRYLCLKDLQALALVDRDCRKLAALHLFSRITLDLRDECFQMVNSLHSGKTQSTHQSALAPLYPYIRRVNVDPPDLLSSPQPRTAVADVTEHDGGEKEITKDRYLRSVGQLVANGLPNLYILDWIAPGIMTTATLESIYSSPTRHLRLQHIIFQDPIDFAPTQNSLPLETLDLEISFSVDGNERRPHHFFHHLFRHAAPTLRQLVWRGSNIDEVYLPDDMPSLSCLRLLVLDNVASSSERILNHFLSENTKVNSLAMDSLTSATWDFYRTRGYISSLKEFCWINHDDSSATEDIMVFLGHNTQLESFHVTEGLSTETIDQCILPLLQSDFRALSTLHLIWTSPTVHELSLRAIASIATLQHLWLSAGNQKAVRSLWEVDHETTIINLIPLRHLQTLAFSKDTYQVPNAHPLAPFYGDYYANKVLPVDIDISKYLSSVEFRLYQGTNVGLQQGLECQVKMRRCAWERWHAERMAAVARSYASKFSFLTWLFVGQLSVALHDVEHPDVLIESSQRDPRASALQHRMSLTMWRPV